MGVVSSAARHPAVWDIVRVDFPYADQVTTRRRPALVVAVPDVHDDFAILWLLMITSVLHTPWPFDVRVSDLGGSGLSHDCVVRTAKIAVLDAQLAVRIGELAATDRAKVQQNLRDLLGVVLPA